MINNTEDLLHLCQINIFTLSQKSKLALNNYAHKNNFDFISIQETKKEKPPALTGYGVEFTRSRGKDGKVGGCALYYKNKFKDSSRLTELERSTEDVIWMLVCIGNKKYIIGAVYIQPDDSTGL